VGLTLERNIDSQIDELRKKILSIGGHVEQALQEATQGLLTRDLSRFKTVHSTEELINEGQIQVDNMCLSILAKQGPVAKDLRLILSIIKINTDLERMGDQCVNISHTGKDYLSRKNFADLKKIERMSEVAREMVNLALDSFVGYKIDLAKAVLAKDDELDSLKNQVFQDMMSHIKSNTQDTEAAIDLILIARNLERMGDHATNIAEDVIFVLTGKDIRHGGFSESSQ